MYISSFAKSKSSKDSNSVRFTIYMYCGFKPMTLDKVD